MTKEEAARAKDQSEWVRQTKARMARCKKPIAKGLNIDEILGDMWEMRDAIGDVLCYIDENGEDFLNSLNGDEEETWEMKMAFSDLDAALDNLFRNYNDGDDYVPDCFDDWFAALNVSEGGLLGYDDFEDDYFRLARGYEEAEGEANAEKRIFKLTKKELIESGRQCFGLAMRYLGVKYRFESLKAVVDIVHDENTGILATIKRIETMYEDLVKTGNEWELPKAERMEWQKMTEALPERLWIE